MEKIYEPINWEGFPSKRTPVNADNLNKMDSAINELDNRIVKMSKDTDTYATKTDAEKVLQSKSDGTQYRAILLGSTQSETSSGLSGDTIGETRFTPKIYANPFEGELHAKSLHGKLKGSAEPVNNLLTTVVGFPLDATMGKKLYDMMTWKFVGQESGNTVITLPDDWTELKIVLALNEGAGIKIPVEIIREMVNISDNKVFLVGGGSGNSAGTSLVRGRISVSETEAKIAIIYSGTMESPVDILSTTYIYVWYR